MNWREASHRSICPVVERRGREASLFGGGARLFATAVDSSVRNCAVLPPGTVATIRHNCIPLWAQLLSKLVPRSGDGSLPRHRDSSWVVVPKMACIAEFAGCGRFRCGVELGSELSSRKVRADESTEADRNARGSVGSGGVGAVWATAEETPAFNLLTTRCADTPLPRARDKRSELAEDAAVDRQCIAASGGTGAHLPR